MSQMIVLPPVLEALRHARDFIAKAAEQHWAIDDYLPRLVVNELVTHAVNLSAPDQHVIIAAYTRAGIPTIEVWDQNPKPPTLQMPAHSRQPTALGLRLLPLIVADWGTRRLVPTGTGNITWCELRH